MSIRTLALARLRAARLTHRMIVASLSASLLVIPLLLTGAPANAGETPELVRLRTEHGALKRCNPAFGWRGTVRYSEKKTRSRNDGMPGETYIEAGDIRIHGFRPGKSYAGASCGAEFSYWGSDEVSGQSSGGGCRVDQWTAGFLVLGQMLQVSLKPKNGVPAGCSHDSSNYGWGTVFMVELAPQKTRYTAHRPGDMSSVSYELSREAPDPDKDEGPLQIQIAGPDCICGEPEGRFVASASGGKGGHFGAFELRTANGGKPTVIRNQGGARAELTLGGDPKNTGRTEIVAVHVGKDGNTTRSAPRQVSFCEIDKPKAVGTPYRLVGDDWKFGARDGQLEMHYRSKSWLDGKEVSERLRWDITGAELFDRADTPAAQREFVAKQMPTRNDLFGGHEVTARVEESGCSCRSEPVTARLFYDLWAKNNPDGKMPNWAYYWRQTKAARDKDGQPMRFQYIQSIPNQPRCTSVLIAWDEDRDASAACSYDYCNDITYCDDDVIKRQCFVSKTRLIDDDIDCFAISLRHENQHRLELTSWWGARVRNYTVKRDGDYDLVPSEVEAKIQGCDPQYYASCPGRLKPDMADIELDAYQIGWSWPQGAADKEDWACPGKQCPK